MQRTPVGIADVAFAIIFGVALGSLIALFI